MTDDLIILRGEGGEGFFRFENGYRTMTVGCKANAVGKKMWAVEGACGELENHTTVKAPCAKTPENCGIFIVEGKTAYPLMTSGSVKKMLGDGFEVKPYSAMDENIRKAEEKPLREAEENIRSVQASEAMREVEREVRSEPSSFWECNQKEFDEMFNKGKPLEALNSLIPDSKWVEGDEYALGVIFDGDGEPLYLCYGFNLEWSEQPPERLEGYSQWIPLDYTHPHDEGYWVVYVNAKTGERVR